MPKRVRAHREWLLSQLRDPDVAAEYLNEAIKESRREFLKALRNVAEARRVALVAKEAGVNRESLYKALSEEGNPRLNTYNSVLEALGLEYEFRPKDRGTSHAGEFRAPRRGREHPIRQVEYGTGCEWKSTITSTTSNLRIWGGAARSLPFVCDFSGEVPMFLVASEKTPERGVRD